MFMMARIVYIANIRIPLLEDKKDLGKHHPFEITNGSENSKNERQSKQILVLTFKKVSYMHEHIHVCT